MKQTRIQMSMPVTVEIVDDLVDFKIFDQVFVYFDTIEERFSTFKNTSEISGINRGEIKRKNYSPEMKEIFQLSEETKKETNGYFNIDKEGKFDTSGIVKGWAIYNAAKLIQKAGFKNFLVDVGSDIQVVGKNIDGQDWRIGIKNPFNEAEIVKVIQLSDQGVATSGNYLRGHHIYNPKTINRKIEDEIISLTVIGSNVYEADRFATAAFAMGKKGIEFIQELKGFEGYQIDNNGKAIYTNGFENYIIKNDENNK